MTAPTGNGWRKMPAVTGREGSCFYARRSPLSGNRQWYMRDRDSGAWEYSEEQDLPAGQTLGYVPVVKIPAPSV